MLSAENLAVSDLVGSGGLAQVNNIDMSTPKLLAKTDARMLAELSVGKYFRYVFMTVFG